jgi:hypothetical protein
MCLTLLAHECRLADWHCLYMLAAHPPHLRGLLVRFRVWGT